ncbi:unnamed protein product [Tilletia controversa]|uniref:Uncharacterized protein n=1 Tax=Tilletia caries TaxID=13290 RepID=A0A177U9P7_9BASI|nr:hypothetical protein A4X03_0g4400 [Tilletia caries]CAD6906892.1 unnamed protein product [Tilletia controversa]
MAPSSNQKRFSRSTGLRRFSSLRVASSPPLPVSSGADIGAPSTSFILPDRSRAREFIRHISNSSTSSSEYSLSAAISPPPAPPSPPPPLPTLSFLTTAPSHGRAKVQSRKGSVVSIGASSTKTFPHGEVFDHSSPPVSPSFLSRPQVIAPTPTFLSRPHPINQRSRKRSVNVPDGPRAGIAGIGAGGSTRETRAAWMAGATPQAAEIVTPQQSQAAEIVAPPQQPQAAEIVALQRPQRQQAAKITAPEQPQAAKVIAPEQPQAAGIAAPQRPPRSSKRVSVMWGPARPVSPLPPKASPQQRLLPLEAESMLQVESPLQTLSNLGTFDTPVPGGFSKFSPATTPSLSSVTRSKPGLEDVSEDASTSISVERIFDEPQQGLGLIFSSNSITPPSSYGHNTPPSSHGHKSDERSWGEEEEEEETVLELDAVDDSDDEEASENHAANIKADSASVAASDQFESADEGSERDWGSRRESHTSRKSARRRSASATSEAPPPLPPSNLADFSQDSIEDEFVLVPIASLAHMHPIPQKTWAAPPDLGVVNAESEAQNMALLRLAKANRRRSNVARVHNNVIIEEPNEAEVLSARRASKRLSKLGLIDMSSARVAEKTKSITARQRLTAFMNATPILLVEPPSHNSWRAKLSVPAFQEMLDRWGPLEMHRQEVLWELCETERIFVQAICSVQKIFALPLRTPEGRWIKGVPCSAARLFDWLEDIFQLHCKIHTTLQRARQQQSPILVHIADQLLRCMLKLEAHQPYLVRFESVTQSIDEMIRSENSVFGQFIKMQMQIPECNSMSFSSFLLKPVQRLMKYPLFFKQLAELTPSTHPDHYATQALLQSTDQVIRDMNDVKAREEDYRDLKLLQSRIKGLPDGFHLATRERRLLRQGQITSVQLTPKEKIQLGLTLNLSDTQQGMSFSLPNSPLTGRAFPSEIRDKPSGMQKSHIAAAESIHSNSSTLSGASMPTDSSEWDAYVAVDPTVRNGRPGSFMSTGTTRSDSSASFTTSSPTIPARDQLDRLVAAKAPSGRKSSMANILLRKEKQKDRETLLQAFVFSDLVVLTTQDEGQGKAKPLRKTKPPSSALERGSKAGGLLNNEYELFGRIGLARILKVTDHSGRCPERPHLLELELLPIKVDSSYSSSFDKRNVASGPVSLFLSFHASGQESSFMSSKSPEQDSVLWYRALERSFLWSLRSRKRNSLMYSSKRESMMSMASSGFRVQTQTAHADWPRRADQVTDLVMAAARAGDAENLASLIQAGLPFPKSPSQQDLATFASEELRMTHSKLYGNLSELSGPTGEADHIPVVGFGILDEAEEEREERRWWALRLTEVRQAAEADREIDAMAEQIRSDMSCGHNYQHHHSSSPTMSVLSDPQQQMLSRQVTNGGRRKVRQGIPVLRSSGNNFSSGHDLSHSSSATVTSVMSTEYRDF